MRYGSLVAVLVVLSGCQTAPIVIRDTPPAALLEDCPEPASSLETNADLVRYALELRTSLRLCNNDKEALRDWAKEPE